jgi:hypothetical protein
MAKGGRGDVGRPGGSRHTGRRRRAGEARGGGGGGGWPGRRSHHGAPANGGRVGRLTGRQRRARGEAIGTGGGGWAALITGRRGSGLCGRGARHQI